MVAAMQITDMIQGFLWDATAANNCNTYLIDGPTPVLIDPGHLRWFDRVERELDRLGLGLESIGLVLCTHAHPDHIEAVKAFVDSPALFAVHEEEWRQVAAMAPMLAAMGLDTEGIAPHFFLKEGELSVDGLELNVFHTPGHSPGSACFYLPRSKALFTGDLIFKEGLGRTDLPGGNGEAIKQSILRMGKLDVEILLPGHGPVVSGRDDVRRNLQTLQQVYFGYI
jgi:hydroxyacylglutathione hydrolase